MTYNTIQDEGSNLTQRTVLNIVGASITASDNSPNARTDVTLSQSPTASTSLVGIGRQVSTTSPLTGGGDLSADRNLGISVTTTNDGGTVVKQGSTPGTTQTGNINISGTAIIGALIANAGDVSVTANLTGSPSNVAGKVNLGTRSFSATPGSGALAHNRLGLLGSFNQTTAQLGGTVGPRVDFVTVTNGSTYVLITTADSVANGGAGMPNDSTRNGAYVFLDGIRYTVANQGSDSTTAADSLSVFHLTTSYAGSSATRTLAVTDSSAALAYLENFGNSSLGRALQIYHTNATGVGDSNGIAVYTSAQLNADTAAGIAIRNAGNGDGIYIGATGLSQPQPSDSRGPTGIGIDLNRGTNNSENNTSNYGGFNGVSLINFSTTSQVGVGIGAQNYSAAGQQPTFRAITDYNAIVAFPVTPGLNAGHKMIALYDRNPFTVSGTTVSATPNLKLNFGVLDQGGVVQQGTTSTPLGAFYQSAPTAGAGFGFAEWIPITTTGSNALQVNRLQTGTMSANFEVLSIGTDVFGAGSFQIYTRQGGTGVSRPLVFGTGGAEALRIQTTQAINSPTQPRSSATNSAAQAIASAAFTALAFDTNITDVGGVHSTAGGLNTKFTVPTGGDGWFMAIGEVVWAVGGGGTQRQIRILKNGGTQIARAAVAPSASFNQDCSVSWQGSLAAGDYLEFQVYQDSGGSLSTIAGATDTWGSIVKIW